MKKNTIKAFTLVEMLIVIVIIGILIAALLPRMQAAQGRARDVSRKTALSQVQSAIVTYQWDHGEWPTSWATNGTWIAAIWDKLIWAWMTEVPADPIKNTEFSWVVAGWTKVKDYGYVIAKRNWVESWWFALMAKTEVAWSANRVVCDESDILTWGTDLAKIYPCSVVEENDTTCKNDNLSEWENKCSWKLDQMRYIIMY